MRIRIALVAVGSVLIAYAMTGILIDDAADPVGVAVFLVAVLIGHDLLWMPAVLATGFLITRLVPARQRNGVRIAALIGAAVVVVALPLALGLGRTADNPSALPLHYGRHLGLILLVVGVVPAVRAVLRKKSERPRGGGPEAEGG
jgi:hypothetical protein